MSRTLRCISRSRSIGLVWALIAAVGTTACLARSAAAQDQPIVFQHGILSNDSTWEYLSSLFGENYTIAPYRYTTGSSNAYETQAGVLVGAMAGLPASTIVVGHSNGGIVAREASKSRPLTGIITVATPHHGAVIMRSIANGEMGQVVDFITGTTAAPFVQYAQYNDQSQAWQNASYFASDIELLGNSLRQFVTIFAAQNASLIAEMVPGSGYNQALNGSANLAREASVVPYRVGVVSTIGNNGMLFRSFLSNSTTNVAQDIRYGAIGAYFAAYDYYSEYDDVYDPYYYEKRYYANMWAQAATTLYFLDGYWCYLIGGSNDPTGWGYCESGDAIVPMSSQEYPNYTNRISYEGASHGEETSSNATYQVIASVLGSAPFNIPERQDVVPIRLVGENGTCQAGGTYHWQTRLFHPADAVYNYLIMYADGNEEIVYDPSTDPNFDPYIPPHFGNFTVKVSVESPAGDYTATMPVIMAEC